MAKKLYTVRLTDHIPMEFDGASWRTMTSPFVAPTNAPAGGGLHANTARGMFAYRGRLYFVYIYAGGSSTYVNNVTRFIRVYSVNPTNDTYTFVTEKTITTVVSGENPSMGTFSTFYNYKDRMYFTLNGGYYVGTHRVVTGFVFDGTTLIEIPFAPSSFGSGGTTWTSSPMCAMAGATIPYRDKLVVAPKGSFKSATGAATSAMYLNNRFYTVDYNQASVSGTLLSLPGSNTGFEQAFYQSADHTLTTLELLFNSYVGGGVYRNTLYGIGVEGIVYRLTDGGSRTAMFDLRDFGRRSPTYTTNQAATSSHALKFSNVIAATNSQLQQVPIGTKVIIRSGPSTGAQGIIVGQSFSLAGVHFEIVDAATRQPQSPWNNASLASGTQFDMYYGTGPNLIYNNGSGASPGAMNQVIMQEGKDGNFYILTTHRSNLFTAAAAAPMSYMYKWDGSENPTTSNLTYQECRITGKAMECSGIDSYYDISSGFWHILYYDAISQAVTHFAWDTVNDRQVVYGSIYAKTNTSENVGLASGLLTPYVVNDITYEFISKSFNEVTKLMTVVVRAYCINDSTSFLQVKYNIGDYWTLATLVDQTTQGVVGGVFANATGTDFTFVHNLGIDEPNYSGTLQYEITGGAGVLSAYSSHSSASTMSESSSTSLSSRTPSSDSTSTSSTSSRTPSSNSSSTSSSSS